MELQLQLDERDTMIQSLMHEKSMVENNNRVRLCEKNGDYLVTPSIVHTLMKNCTFAVFAHQMLTQCIRALLNREKRLGLPSAVAASGMSSDSIFPSGLAFPALEELLKHSGPPVLKSEPDWHANQAPFHDSQNTLLGIDASQDASLDAFIQQVLCSESNQLSSSAPLLHIAPINGTH